MKSDRQVRFYVSDEADEAMKYLKDKWDMTGNEVFHNAMIVAKRAVENNDENIQEQS